MSKVSCYIGRTGPKKWSDFGRWAYNAAGFNQYGLHHNDCLSDELCPYIKLAVSRLPPDLFYARNHRIFRALHLSMMKQVLPKEEWICYENDHKYLEPYLEEVYRERDEHKKWNEIF